MFAKDIMTKDVVTVTSHASIAESIKKLIDNRVSGLPVIDENAEVVGVVTEKDLLVAYDFVHKKDVSIRSFMSTEVLSINEDMPAEEISRLLVRKNIKRVPVIKDRKLIGIVSRRDVIKYILDKEE